MRIPLRLLVAGFFISASSFPAAACNWTAAKNDIDWVLKKDSGAKQRYSDARKCGFKFRIKGIHIWGSKCLNKFDAVVEEGQHHNPHARATIRACKARAESYIAKHG